MNRVSVSAPSFVDLEELPSTSYSSRAGTASQHLKARKVRFMKSCMASDDNSHANSQGASNEDQEPFLTRVIYSAFNLFSLGSNSRLEASKRQMDWLRHMKSSKKRSDVLRNDITLDEVGQHNKEGDAWIVFNQQVYDVSSYHKFHPGGSALILRYAGTNATTAFMKQHPYVNIRSILQSCLLGSLAKSALQVEAEQEILAWREKTRSSANSLRQVKSSSNSAGGESQDLAAASATIQRKNSSVFELEQHLKER